MIREWRSEPHLRLTACGRGSVHRPHRRLDELCEAAVRIEQAGKKNPWYRDHASFGHLPEKAAY